MNKVWYLIVIGLVVALSLEVAPVQAKHTWTVIAGGGTRDLAVVANAFYPRSLEVGVGDTIAWQFQGFHTVTFLSGQQPPPLEVREGDKAYFNPKIFFPAGGKAYAGTGFSNSGTPALDPKAPPLKYSLTFTKAGTFRYDCLVHPGMSGTVTVKAHAKRSPAAAASRGRRQQSATIKTGLAAWAAYTLDVMGSTVVAPMLGDAKAGYSLLRFTPKPITVKPGTIVTWKMADPFEIHTVTFLGGQKPPEFVLVEPQKQGPPKLAINPKAAAPTQTKTYDGMGYVNSGILFAPGAPGNPPTSFSLTFTKAGRYDYVCLVHVAEGMKSTVIVK